MQKEIVMEKNYLAGDSINTIYFGGGTPSLLSEKDLERLFNEIAKNYKLSDNVEITLEANPDDITGEKLKAWKSLSINRLSIGVQSFYEEELRWMNRAHTATEAITSLQLAIKSFDNITIDLIYGSPLLTDEMWQENVNTATGLGIQHLSCYALTVEEKTPLHKLISSGTTTDVENEKQARQFLLLMKWLREKGYEHYEVSNFARPGFRSRHNSAYWKGDKYLGIGPSAHSYNGAERRWNVANNQTYIKTVSENKPAREIEILTTTQQVNEYIMISLRTMEGLDLEKIQSQLGEKEKSDIEIRLKKFIDAGLIQFNHSIARLTDEGMLRADGLASDLFQ